jgi:hypothetical protein
MSRTALTNYDDYEEIINYVRNGSAGELSPEKREILERWQVAATILRQYPTKMEAARRLRARFPHISIRQAQIDIDNGCKFWNINNKIDWEWIEGLLIEKLLLGISQTNPGLAQAKYLNTLKDLLLERQEVPIDPKLIEKNIINIQFNLNGNTISLSREALNKLPDAMKYTLLQGIPNEITEEQAAEIINIE